MKTSTNDRSNKTTGVEVSRPSDTPRRKSYSGPRLTVHGTVESITRNPSGVNTDGVGGSHGPVSP
jgi:hypothetical protein